MNEKPEIKPMGITPLKHICMTIGELPSSYLESMTYYEQLLWLTKFLQERMIPALDNNALAVEELQRLFIELQNYVNNYFDNLDVQEEINNKLDQMLEDGVLEQIIEQFLQSTALWCYDTLNNLKEATNLINGSYAKTLGYYSINDGGGATYRITNTASETEYQEELENGLYATLIIEDNLNIKQIGIQENTDETIKFNKIFQIENINIIIPNGTYQTKYLTIGDNINLIGIGNPTINIDIDNNNNIMSTFGSNNIIKNINFISMSDDKYGSRMDIYNQNNIIIENCNFEHFIYLRNNYAMPILIRNSSNITIKNCKFSNNSQDFAISHGNCENIYISNCVFNNVLNFEVETGTLKNLYVDNNVINRLLLYTYSNISYDIDDTIISNNNINTISFKGAKFKLINNTIKDFDAKNWLTESASVIENINSIKFDEQLNNDPNFFCFGPRENIGTYNYVRDNWEEGYIPNAITGKKENGIRLISLNNSNISQTQSIHKTFEIEEETKYLIRTIMKITHQEEGSWSNGSLLLNLSFYTESNEQVGDTIQVSIDKLATANSESELNEKWIPLLTPTNAKYLRVVLYNSRNNVAEKTNSLWNSFKLNKISVNNMSSDDDKSYISSPYTLQIPKMGNVRMIGDVIYNNDITTNAIEKWICTNNKQSSSYIPTYKYIKLSND